MHAKFKDKVDFIDQKLYFLWQNFWFLYKNEMNLLTKIWIFEKFVILTKICNFDEKFVVLAKFCNFGENV